MAEKLDPTFVPMSEAVQGFVKQLDSQTEDDFFPTGFPSHDLSLGRLRRGTLTLVGARPSIGKTAFMGSMALRQLEAGIQVYFFSLEMPIYDMIARLVSIKTGIPLFDVLQRRTTDAQVQEIVGTLPTLASFRADWAEDSNLKNMGKLFAQIERGSRSIVYVDFLGLVQVPGMGAADSYAATTEVGLSLKRAALTLQIPVVAAVQLNRNVELRREKHPILSDFRDSGGLEEAADLALGLYRPGFTDDKLSDNELQVFCLKHRNGPRLNYMLAWDKECARAREKTSLSWTEVA